MCQEPGSASLPCTTVAVRRGAGAQKDSIDALLCHTTVTTAGCFISYFVSETHSHQFVGGAQPLRPAFRGAAAPASSVQGGCSPPRPPRFLRQCLSLYVAIFSIFMFLISKSPIRIIAIFTNWEEKCGRVRCGRERCERVRCGRERCEKVRW